MSASPSELSDSQPNLETVDIEPGKQITLVTRSWTLYEIQDVREVEGAMVSTVVSRPATQDGEGIPPTTIDDAHLISWPSGHEPYSMQQISLGARVEVIGIDRATQERVDFKTSPVESITLGHPPEELDVEMLKQIQESLDELMVSLGVKTTRDLMWLLTDPKFQESIRYYRQGDVVEFLNYKQD